MGIMVERSQQASHTGSPFSVLLGGGRFNSSGKIRWLCPLWLTREAQMNQESHGEEI